MIDKTCVLHTVKSSNLMWSNFSHDWLRTYGKSHESKNEPKTQKILGQKIVKRKKNSDCFVYDKITAHKCQWCYT